MVFLASLFRRPRRVRSSDDIQMAWLSAFDTARRRLMSSEEGWMGYTVKVPLYGPRPCTWLRRLG
ncbi:hypothetical protein EMIT0P74_90265 [Pseudomonas sp. IT-P74]